MLKQTETKNTERAFLTTEQVISKILGLLSHGQIAEAAALYSRCQDDVGYLLINKVKNQNDLQRLVANLFFRARDFDKAALCCENLGENAKAAALYEQSDDYSSAAEMYAKVENFEKAAEMFERNQNYRQAAELYLKVKNFSRAAHNYEKAVDYFLAGKIYHELGKYRKSMELLQKVQADEDNFPNASILIGEILSKNGYVDLAIKKLLNVIKGRPVDQETAPLYYHLARLHQTKGNPDVAKNVFLQLFHFDVGFLDVEEKIKELDQDPQANLETSGSKTGSLLELSDTAEMGTQVVGVMDGFDFLQKVPLFEDMPLSMMKTFYQVCEERVFQKGEVLIEQDTPGMALFVIRRGRVSVQKRENGQAKEVAQLGEGDHLGEMSLIEERPTSARVVAKEEVLVFEISRDHFLRFMDADDKFANRVLRVFVRTLCQRLRETTAKLVDV